MIELRTLGTVDVRAPGVTLLSVIHRPKHIALLAYLAIAAPRGYHRRDTLVALLWPESEPERARAALRKVLHGLRQSLGAAAVPGRGDEDIALAPETVRCDVVAFEERLSAGEPEDALALYGGPLLPGLHVSGAPEYEHWLERERDRLQHAASGAAWAAAGRAETAGDANRALARAREAVDLAGPDDLGVRRLLELHGRLGDPAGALLAFEAYRVRLEAELDLSPGPETVRAVESIRDRLLAGSPEQPGTTAPAQPEAAAVSAAVGSAAGGLAREARPRARGTARTLLRASAAGAIALAALGLWKTVERGNAEVRPVIAVGAVRDLTDEAIVGADALGDLLATNLARAPGLRVISTARMYELLGPGEHPGRRGEMPAAARQAGATELLEGALHRTPAGALRLDLRRVDLGSGAVRAAVSVEGAALFDLVDRATARLAQAFGAAESDLRVADVTTRSITAFSAYQQGLRAYYRDGDGAVAHAFFTAALEEDTAFAMAAYYAGMSAGEPARTRALLERALALSRLATERERLLIRASWASHMNRPERLAIAETLAARYPAEADGHYLVGRGLIWSGEFLAAVPHLERVVAMDEAALSGQRARCRGCDALAQLVTAYLFADSVAAALRTAKRWTRAMPQSAGAYDALANVLEAAGRYREALAARRRQAALAPGNVYPAVYPAVLAIREGDFARADELLNAQLRHGVGTIARSARWYAVISLRHQGRFREALELVRANENGGAPGQLQALILMESGRWRESAAIFGALAAAADPAAATDAWAAREVAWSLTRQADALAAGGDTTRLRDLAGRIRAAGSRSAYGRDHRLHHHVLGLWHAARGEHVEAVARFRQAIFSTTGGYTRTNVQLARSLLALDRSAEAVAVLEPALRNPGLQASTLYVTHSEVHELLGRALMRNGQPDSAAFHLHWVERAWRRADPPLHTRLSDVRSLLASQTDSPL